MVLKGENIYACMEKFENDREEVRSKGGGE